MSVTETVDERSADELALVDFLRQRDVACPLCGYNLRGLVSRICPECGSELALSVGLVEPRIGAWIACLVALTAAGGLGVLAGISVLQHGWNSYMNWAGQIAFCYFMATVLLVPVLIRSRRRYRRLSERTQWTLAGVAITLTTLAFGAIVIQ